MNKKNFSMPVKVPSSATAKDLKSLTWQSLAFYNQLYFNTRKRNTNGYYIPVASKYLIKQYGKHYINHVRDLVKKDWIEVNSRYSNGNQPFTKSYRLSITTFPQKHKNYIIFLGKRSWEKFFKTSKSEDHSDTSSEYLKLIKERHDMLAVPYWPRSAAGIKLKSKLDRKIASLSRKSGGRAFSTIIQIDKPARKHVVFGKFGKLVNVDITAAAPQILNIGINDLKWEKWIRSGFLKSLSEAAGISPNKKTASKVFMKAVSTKPKSEKIQRVSDYLYCEFPEIMAKVDTLNQMSSVQGETQKEEARLVEDFIMTHKHLTVIPAHDGLFCGESIALEVQDAFETFLKKKSLLGLVKISPDLPHLRRRTNAEILEDLFKDEQLAA